MGKTVCIVFVQRWPNQGVMQTIAEERRERERESLSKEEGGTVVKKNLYMPPASLFAPTQGCKTLPVMQHVKIQRRLPPGICEATRLSSEVRRKDGTIWMNGAGRKEERYQPEADAVVVFEAGEVRDCSPLVTEELQI